MRRATAAGFTLLEVMIAVAVLGIVTLSMLAANGRLVGTVARERIATQAAEVADAQIALVRLWPTYSSLEATFNGTTDNYPSTGWKRVTAVTRIGGAGELNDFKRVTVTVSAPGLKMPLARSITVAAP